MEINGVRIAKIFLNNNDGDDFLNQTSRAEFETTLIKTNIV